MVIVILQRLLLHKSLQQGHGASISVHFGALFSVPAPTVSLWCMTKRGYTFLLKAGLDVESPAQQLTICLQSTYISIHYRELIARGCSKASERGPDKSRVTDSRYCYSYFMNKGSASHLTAFLAWDSSPYVLAAPAQLMRSGIGRKATTECFLNTSGRWASAESEAAFRSACAVHVRNCYSWWLSGVHKSVVVRTLAAEPVGRGGKGGSEFSFEWLAG